MKVGVFSCKSYDREFLGKRNKNYGFELEFLECALTPETAVLSQPFDAISVFVDDVVDRSVLDVLKDSGVFHIALRCSGFNNIDLDYAKELGIGVSRVPSYSPDSVAEHTLALILALDQQLVKAYSRVANNHYELDDLLGFNLKCKTVGVIGTGKIGKALIKLLNGFDCTILCSDPSPSMDIIDMGHRYVDTQSLIAKSDIISLHCPLTASSQHLIDHSAIQKMRDGVMLINTSRGGLTNMQAIFAGLKSKKIGYLGIDVYEMESELSQSDLICESIEQNTYQRLVTFPNVLITYHQGFFTKESLIQVADTTLTNLQYYFAGRICNETFLN